MPVEFISLTPPNASTELVPNWGAPIDLPYLIRYARTLDDYAFNYTLIPYDSGGNDPFTIGATILAHTKNLNVIIALRPNTLYPTVAAKALATLDQLSGGRVVVHFIAGGSDVEQAREGDFLPKHERYARLEEYIRILRRAWEGGEPFDWQGTYYTFKGFNSRVRPTNGPRGIKVSVGGSSDEAYRVGGSLADIFGLWGEPLKETKEQIDRIFDEAKKAGRADDDRPRIWVTFRPIVAETDELAWKKAHATLATLQKHNNPASGTAATPRGPISSTAAPQNVGSQRLLAIAAKGEVQDRALWYPTVTATNARGASTALVGSYETVAQALLDYTELGADLLSIRGYDNFNDVVDYGRWVLPRVREVLEKGKGSRETQTETEVGAGQVGSGEVKGKVNGEVEIEGKGELAGPEQQKNDRDVVVGENGVSNLTEPKKDASEEAAVLAKENGTPTFAPHSGLKEKVVDGLKSLGLSGHKEKNDHAGIEKTPEVGEKQTEVKETPVVSALA